ncbi:unnamed protein product [Brachionus calyciflorus]|uniref:Uncharacterized protein n=1 Tax=Brachionus calyciflorus TaxID=104777 RepID=A0A813M8S7_9BILA|nr:unnamed protein product [Brachionus calyciflorus]
MDVLLDKKSKIHREKNDDIWILRDSFNNSIQNLNKNDYQYEFVSNKSSSLNRKSKAVHYASLLFEGTFQIKQYSIATNNFINFFSR